MSLRHPGVTGIHIIRFFAILSLTAIVTKSQPQSGTPVHTESALSRERIVDGYGRLPMSFEPNVGQTDPRFRYLSHDRAYDVYMADTEVVFGRRSSGPPDHPLRMKFVESAGIKVSAEDELQGRSNYLIGRDASKWRTNIRQFRKVRYSRIAPDVDAVFYGQEGTIEYDLIIAPDASDPTVTVSFEGAKSMRLDEHGDLLMEVDGGEFRQTIPDAYQLIHGKKQHVRAAATISGNTVQITAGSYDHHHAVYIDPVIVYSTYLGTTSVDYGAGIRADNSGNAYIVGETMRNVFITKLTPNGDGIVYSTVIGSPGGDDLPLSMALDQSGNVYVLGFTNGTATHTQTTDFQLVNPFKMTGYRFLFKLNASGTALVYSSFVDDGGGGAQGRLALDPQNAAYITGSDLGGSFVGKVDPAGSGITFKAQLWGGSAALRDIAVDSLGQAYVVGTTLDATFPIVNASPPSDNSA